MERRFNQVALSRTQLKIIMLIKRLRTDIHSYIPEVFEPPKGRTPKLQVIKGKRFVHGSIAGVKAVVVVYKFVSSRLLVIADAAIMHYFIWRLYIPHIIRIIGVRLYA